MYTTVYKKKKNDYVENIIYNDFVYYNRNSFAGVRTNMEKDLGTRRDKQMDTDNKSTEWTKKTLINNAIIYNELIEYNFLIYMLLKNM